MKLSIHSFQTYFEHNLTVCISFRNFLYFAKMRLAAHKLPKGVNRKVRTMKHKDSAGHIARKEKKLAKANGMDQDTEEGDTLLFLIYYQFDKLNYDLNHL